MDNQVRLVNLRVYQQRSDAQVIGWNALGLGGLDLSTITINVYRKYATTGDSTLVATTTADQSFVEVTDVNLKDQWRAVYYDLEVEEPNGTFRYENVSLSEEKPTGRTMGLRRNTNFLLKQGGTPVLIYNRIVDGTRCSCYDPILGDAYTASCASCYNTGYEGGFYTPILTLANITPEAETNTSGDTVRQETSTTILMGHFPKLKPRDLIYEIGYGRRYRIATSQPIEEGRFLINQQLTVVRLSPSDVENNLPVPDLSTLEPVISRNAAHYGLRNMLQSNEAGSVTIEPKKV